jgi:5-methylcytosine-specific restriction enzyme subunit McrC
VSRLYNRLNDDYQPMHGLCRLMLEHMGPGVKTGKHDFIPFMLYMPGFFEMFMARWLAAHLPGDITAYTQYRAKLSASAELEVRIDIVLREATSGRNIAVLDTKYKDTVEPSMSDIQQAAFYANEMCVGDAFLVYPSTETKPMWVRNGGVIIQTLVFDLGLAPDEAGVRFLDDLNDRLSPVKT